MDKLTITRPGGRWILFRGAITAPLAWAGMTLLPLFLAFDEASGREELCRRCDEGSFSFPIDDGVISGGNRALWIGVVLGVAVQALVLGGRLRAARNTPKRKRRHGPRDRGHPAFVAAGLALAVQAVAIALAILIRAQPAHFYLTLAIAGFAIALLPSYLAWFLLPAFHNQPEIEAGQLLEVDGA